MIERQRVGHRGHLVGISPEHFDAFARLPGSVPLAEEVVGRRRCRAGSTGEELNVHLESGGIHGDSERFITAYNSSQLDGLCPIS